MSRIDKDIIGKPKILFKKRNFKEEIKSIESLDIEMTGVCNLNCAGCTHFSPISEKTMINFELLKKDIHQLKVVFGNDIKRICIMGGEPLLNPDTKDLFGYIRSEFPNITIVLTTNGILLLTQKDEFWDEARRNNVSIEVTKYPIDLEFKQMKKVAAQKGVNLYFYGRTKVMKKTLYQLPLDIRGKQDKEDSFKKCFMSRNCTTMRDGKIFPCSVAAYIQRFNRAFGKNIPISNDDFGDIYTESKEEILRKLSYAIPMCCYCDVNKRTYGNTWRRSSRIIDEWI